MDKHRGNIEKILHKLSHSITRGNVTILCVQCKGRKVCCSNRHPMCFLTCGYGTRCPHATGGIYCQANHQTRPKAIQKIHLEIIQDTPMLCVKLKKALYGTWQAELLFWRLLSSTLKERRFKLNEYNQCIVNKTVKGKQFLIILHVDDLPISHIDEQVVGDIIKQLNRKFRKEGPLTTTWGKY